MLRVPLLPGCRHVILTNDSGVVDVTGAGDQFLATLACQKGTGIGMKRAAWLANLAAGMQCERMGIVPVTAEELQARAAEIEELPLAVAG
jgi:bifunctional ADP-heptose synthase (sugar kinase/adenylyltransferase)